MDIRTISGAAYSRPAVPIPGNDGSAPPESTKPADTAAPYFSPVYHFDPVAKLSILSFRDPDSGAITQQIPNERVVEQYRRTHGDSPLAKPATSSDLTGASAADAGPTSPAGTAAGPGAAPSATPASDTAVPAAAVEATGAPVAVPASTPALASTPEAPRVSLKV